MRVPLVSFRFISGTAFLIYRISVSLSLPARSVVRRVAFFGSCTFWIFSFFFSPFLCSRLRLAQSSSPSACSSNTVASCRVSVLVSSALLNSRCQWRWVCLFCLLLRLLVSTARGSLGRISSDLVVIRSLFPRLVSFRDARPCCGPLLRQICLYFFTLVLNLDETSCVGASRPTSLLDTRTPGF